MSAGPTVDVIRVTRRFGSRPALDSVSLRVGHGERVAVMGPSGCGKTTLLRLTAGLERPDTGTVCRSTERVGIVFQEHRLLPWRPALDNVAVAIREGTTAHRRARARDCLAAVGLDADAQCLPAALSGGMRQRVALARALAVSPDLLILDEPTTSLDGVTRRHIHECLEQCAASRICSVVVVTHSAVEASLLADRVVILEGGPDGGRVAVELTVGSDRTDTVAAIEKATLPAELQEEAS